MSHTTDETVKTHQLNRIECLMMTFVRNNTHIAQEQLYMQPG